MRRSPGPFSTRPTDLAPIVEGEHWGRGWDHAWFHLTGEIPDAWAGREVVVWLDLGTEGLVFDANGRVTQGIAPGNLFINVSWQSTRPVDGPFCLELHRGTLTTHAFVKWANRRLEEALQSLEILWSAAPAAAWPTANFDAAWKIVLRNQFHDIIPGTSIAQVYTETDVEYRETFAATDQLAAQFARENLSAAPGSVTLFNSLPHPWNDLVRLPDLLAGAGLRDAAGELVAVQNELTRVYVPALSFATFTVVPGASVAPVPRFEEPLVLENALIRYEFDADARLIRAYMRERHDWRVWLSPVQRMISAGSPKTAPGLLILSTHALTITCGNCSYSV